MAFGLPDWLIYDMRHRLERLPRIAGTEGLRDWLNDRPLIVLGVAVALVGVLGVVLALTLRSQPPRALQEGQQAWFYDLNTRRLFVSGSDQSGPIAAPSGPLPNGDPAGVRARVYSYVLEPNESELFVGLLERPDPAVRTGQAGVDMMDVAAWQHARLIKRADDRPWVPAISREGRAILDELTRPNARGQTPVYQMPGQSSVVSRQ